MPPPGTERPRKNHASLSPRKNGTEISINPSDPIGHRVNQSANNNPAFVHPNPVVLRQGLQVQTSNRRAKSYPVFRRSSETSVKINLFRPSLTLCVAAPFRFCGTAAVLSCLQAGALGSVAGAAHVLRLLEARLGGGDGGGQAVAIRAAAAGGRGGGRRGGESADGGYLRHFCRASREGHTRIWLCGGVAVVCFAALWRCFFLFVCFSGLCFGIFILLAATVSVDDAGVDRCCPCRLTRRQRRCIWAKIAPWTGLSITVY